MGHTPAQKSFDHDFLYSKTVKIAHVEVALRSFAQCLQANSSSRQVKRNGLTTDKASFIYRCYAMYAKHLI